MSIDVYDTRVVPFVRYEKIQKNGKTYEVTIDNLTNDERKNMSCEPRMLWQNEEHIYMAEMPLSFSEGTSVKSYLYYVFAELTFEEQEKYFDRSIVIPTTVKNVVEIYDDSSKKIFGKKRFKRRK